MQKSKNHILIVDDEDGIRDLLKERLEEEGYTCHTASTGDAALEVLTAEPVHVALLDVIMPGMTGLSLFKQIKENYPKVAVVFVTAVDDLNLAVDHLKNGAYDYVVKSVTRIRLRQVIEEALRKRKASLEGEKHRRLLEDQTARLAQDLDAKVGEISSLKRVFQAELSEKFTTEAADYLKVVASKKKQLLRTIVYLQESEKKRISDYLHGHVQSKLLVLRQRLGECQELMSRDPQKISALLGEIKTGLRSVQVEDIRRASHDLYPYVVNQGLVPALKSLADRFSEVIKIQLYVAAELQSMEEQDRKIFSEEFKIGVYRITEEALANVVKHSGAKATKVELYYDGDGHISLNVTDDGRGFETSKVSSAFGVLAMKDYAEALGGSYGIDSTPGHGTRIHLTLPVPAGVE